MTANLKNLIDDAERKTTVANAAAAAARLAIHTAMERLLPPGTVIDLRDPARERPEYLCLVRTLSGNDHRTRVFRIDRLVSVRFDALRPELTEWEADATPISEKTGKDMSGRVAHSTNQRGGAVRIGAPIVIERGFDEKTVDQAARMLALLEGTR